jgi:hypothetical protein
VEKQLKAGAGADLEDIEIEAVVRDNEEKCSQIKVMIIGRLENPRLQCLRELKHADSKHNMIPLGVKKSGAQQKFRIPFKNLSNTLEGDFDFTFVKVASKRDESSSEDEEDLTPCLEFFC